MTLTQDAPAVPRYEMKRWDLSALLPEASEAVIAAKIEELEEAVAQFEELRDCLQPTMDAEEFLAILRRYEAILTKMDILGGYASLWFASNTLNAEALGYRNHIRQVLTQIQNRFLFFTLWWKGLSPETAEKLLPRTDLETSLSGHEIEDFRHYLEELRRFSPHTLDERSEQIINIKNANGIEAVVTLYSMLTNRLEYRLTVDGEAKRLTDGEIRSLYYHPDPALREASFKELLRVYEVEKPVLAQLYAHRVRDWHNEYVEMRGVATPISMRNLSNDIPDAAVEALLDSVKRNAPLFQEYFRLKASWLGMEKLRRYDVYAPLAMSHQKIDYPDAVNTVLETFYGFHERMGQLAERVFVENHIDATIRKGKKSGAFCATIIPELTPWVMINYTGRVRDVATLAHEVGHAVHSMLAENHSLLTQHAQLPLAETASVFAEMLITDRLLAAEKDPMVRRELLAAAVDDVYATVIRQSFFVRFEIEAHKAVQANCTAEELSDLYYQNLVEQFGDSVDVAHEFRHEWVAIPHLFTTPFYCYAYSFGQLLVLALYQRFKEEGDGFKEPYVRLLSYGGSMRPAAALEEMGIDVTDPDFWQGGFKVVRGMIDELRSLNGVS